MKIWKQKYKVLFEIDVDVEISAIFQGTDEEEYQYDDIMMIAKSKIEGKTALKFSELNFEFITLVLIDSPENPKYIAAKWLYENGRNPISYDWNDYQDAIKGSGVDEEKVEFEELKKYLQMVNEMEESN